MNAASFHGSYLKIQRGNRHLAELDNLLTSYGGRIRAAYVPLRDDPTQSRLTFSEPPPPEIALILGDAIHNFRAALDLMVCTAALNLGKSPDKFFFPFAENAGSLEKILNGILKKLGKEVTDAIRSLKPYNGGNSKLRGLHDLDIMDKHKLIIPVMPCVWWSFDFLSFALRNNPSYHLDTSDHAMMLFGDFYHLRRLLDVEGDLMPTDDANDMVNFLVQETGAIALLFADGLPFARKHVIPTLEELAQLTLEIVHGFEDQFGRQCP